MSEEVFRIAVTVAVVVASLAFIVQACIMFALYRVTRKAQENTDRLTTRFEPLVAKVEPALERAGSLIEQAGPVLARLGPVISKAGATIEKVGPVLDQAVPAIEKIGPAIVEARAAIAKAAALADSATQVTLTANRVIEDARPGVVHITNEAGEITRLGREQMERMSDLLQDAGDMARARLEQIDQSVGSTIEQVEQVSGAMKRAVLKPVREVNGLAAGISAAVSTLVRGHRKSSVDSATQDEEMFI